MGLSHYTTSKESALNHITKDLAILAGTILYILDPTGGRDKTFPLFKNNETTSEIESVGWCWGNRWASARLKPVTWYQHLFPTTKYVDRDTDIMRTSWSFNYGALRPDRLLKTICTTIKQTFLDTWSSNKKE